MSRGRPRHQASRRKTYSVRQHELRERETRAAREDRAWEVGQIVPVEVDDTMDSDVPASWPVSMPDRAPAV